MKTSKTTQKVRGKAVISAQQLAISLHSEMSSATTACNSSKTEVLRPIKEVAEPSTKRTAGREHFALLISSSTTVRNRFFATLDADRYFDSPFQSMRPAEVNPWQHVPSTSAALWDTRSVSDECTSKRKEAEKFKSEQWPQASKVEPILRTNSSSSSMPQWPCI